MIELSSDLGDFFRERLLAALNRQDLAVDEQTEAYIVNLLAGFVRTPVNRALAKPLVERMAEAHEASVDSEKFRLFRDLGDCALYACGFFSDHLVRRGVSRDYVVTMGGQAYVAAGGIALRAWGSDLRGSARVYPSLAEQFDALARVLDDVRETTSFQTPQDVVRLYERWRRNGSPLLAERLQREGVFPQGDSAERTLH